MNSKERRQKSWTIDCLANKALLRTSLSRRRRGLTLGERRMDMQYRLTSDLRLLAHADEICGMNNDTLFLLRLTKGGDSPEFHFDEVAASDIEGVLFCRKSNRNLVFGSIIGVILSLAGIILLWRLGWIWMFLLLSLLFCGLLLKDAIRKRRYQAVFGAQNAHYTWVSGIEETVDATLQAYKKIQEWATINRVNITNKLDFSLEA
jgi:hypothetical protein